MFGIIIPPRIIPQMEMRYKNPRRSKQREEAFAEEGNLVLIDTPDELNTKLHKTIPFERYNNILELIDDAIFMRSEAPHKRVAEVRDYEEFVLLIIDQGKCIIYCFSEIYVKLA